MRRAYATESTRTASWIESSAVVAGALRRTCALGEVRLRHTVLPIGLIERVWEARFSQSEAALLDFQITHSLPSFVRTTAKTAS